MCGTIIIAPRGARCIGLTVFAERIACIALVGRMVGPVDRPLFPFVFPNERAPVTLDVRTYIRTSRISSRKQFAVKAVDRDETESWRRKPRRGAAPASHLPGLPILRDYLSESTTFNSHRQRTTYAKHVYNIHFPILRVFKYEPVFIQLSKSPSLFQ